jgi:hypothetical protein
MPLPPPLHHKAQVLVAEYAGAVAPGRVIALAVATAMDVRRTDPSHRTSSAEFLEQWEDRTRRRLWTELAGDLARTSEQRAAAC